MKRAPERSRLRGQSTKAKSDFGDLYRRLREIMHSVAGALEVQTDAPGNYYVNTGETYQGKPVFFGGVREGKAYVSFHLFPIYLYPDLLRGLSPELRKRMQGKSCFNFKVPDETAFDELARLTKRGLQEFRKRGVPR